MGVEILDENNISKTNNVVYQVPTRESVGRLQQYVIKLSGGRVKTDEQATKIILVLVVLIFLAVAYFMVIGPYLDRAFPSAEDLRGVHKPAQII